MPQQKLITRVVFGGHVVRPIDDKDVEPKWNQLFVFGTFHRSDFPDGELVVDRAFLQSMVDNWVKGGRQAKPIDSLHRGDSGEDGLPAEEKSARGWIEDLKLKDDGLWGLVRWNAKGLGFILGDEYRYLSPSFHPNWVDSRSGDRQGPTLFGAALLNNPFLEELPRVAASRTGDEPKESQMNKKLICSYLGMPEDTDDDAVHAAIKKLCDTSKKMAADAESLKLAQGNLDTVKTESLKLAERVTTLEKTNAELRKAQADAGLAGLIEKLESQGRIIAADKEAVGKLVTAIGLEEAAKLTATWPVKVKLGEKGVAGNGDVDDPGAAKKRLDALVAEHAKATGLSLFDARMAVIGMSEHRVLVDTASKLLDSPKN